jgi:hypothetical protein
MRCKSYRVVFNGWYVEMCYKYKAHLDLACLQIGIDVANIPDRSDRQIGDTFEITFAYLWCQNRPQYIGTLQVEIAEFILSPEQIRILIAWRPTVSRVRYEPGVEDPFSSAQPE